MQEVPGANPVKVPIPVQKADRPAGNRQRVRTPRNGEKGRQAIFSDLVVSGFEQLASSRTRPVTILAFAVASVPAIRKSLGQERGARDAQNCER